VKFAIVIAVVALLGSLAIVLPKPQEQEPDLSERCAPVLVAMAKLVPTRPNISYSGAEVSVAGRQVRLSARIENRKRAEKKFLVALAVDLFVDGVLQPLTVGSVGVGDSEEEAENTAIQEWAAYVGSALFASLVSDHDAGLPINGFVAFPGLPGIRGAEVPLPEHIDKDLLEHLETLIPNLRSSRGELHSILIMVKVEQGRVAGGECRVDGVISTDAMTAIRSFRWPPTQDHYLFKQFYILRRR
jgi:hypothetical protein